MKGFFAKSLSKLSAKLGERVEMDAAALFDHTMLHEMTHAISTNPTNDVGGPTKAYGWANCLALSPWGLNAITLGGSSGNADSYAYLGLGVSMIAKTAYPEAPNEDVSLE